MNVTFNKNTAWIATLSSQSSTSSGIFGSLSSSLSDYASIRSGSYGKLLRAYYNQTGTDKSSSETTTKKTKTTENKTSTSTSADSTETLTNVKSSSENLKKAADALKDSKLYEKKTVKADDGTETEDYDMDALYEKVSAFANSYNDALTKAQSSQTRAINTNTKLMTTATSANKSMLSKIGVTIDEKGKMSVDKDTFKKADVNNVKNLFKEGISYGSNVGSKASSIAATASKEASKANTYQKSGTYSNNYTTGDIFQSII